MKELQEIDSKVEIVEEQQQRKEIKLIGRQRRVRGLTLWEFNHKEKTLQPAKFHKQDFAITALSTSPEALKISNKVVVNENCVYVQALNRKNAIKKLNNPL